MLNRTPATNGDMLSEGVSILTASTIQRARELGAAGCDPPTIGTLLAAEGYSKAREVMTEAFATELKRIAQQSRKESSNPS
jgi:hypothetical protein